MAWVRRAICAPLQRQAADSTASLRAVSKTVRKESTVRGRSASQIARLARSMRTPQNGVRVERVG
eukprot:3615062-Lingulodinium_polyedra.AAC.1